METEVQNIQADALIDLFPGIGTNPTIGQGGKVNFGGQHNDFDVFKSTTDDTTLPSTTDDTTLPSTSEQTTLPSTTDETTEKGNADILGDSSKKTTTPLADLSNYYQERIKSGKFVAIQEEDAKGNKVDFIPKTAEEYDEVLELQINYRLDEAKRDMEKKWYDSKSPAWKAVSQYAEMVDDPTQLIPFLQGVRTIQSVSNLDENDIAGAEAIVRVRLGQRGDPEEIVNSQIDALKTTDKLIATAKQYKPIILQQEQQELGRKVKEEQAQQQEYIKLVTDIRENALKAIENPIFGKTKLKQEEKAAIYDLIAEPSEETQGYGVYTAIDKLFDTKDFETLKEIALLLSKKDAFYNYLGTAAANHTAASLEKKLRVAGDTHRSSGNDFDEEDRRPTVTRNQFNKKPNFGGGDR